MEVQDNSEGRMTITRKDHLFEFKSRISNVPACRTQAMSNVELVIAAAINLSFPQLIPRRNSPKVGRGNGSVRHHSDRKLFAGLANAAFTD